jgi:hypothetical protein
MPPPKLPLTTVAGHDPIYPFLPFVLLSLSAMSVPDAFWSSRNVLSAYSYGKTHLGRAVRGWTNSSDVHLRYISIRTRER